MNYNIKNCVYLIRCPEHADGLVKIGLTTDLDQRMNSLNGATETPVPFNVIAVVETDKYKQLETHLHHIYAAERVNPKREFFKFKDESGTSYIDDVIDMMRECAELTGGKFHLFNEGDTDDSDEKQRRFTFKQLGLQPGAAVTFDAPNCSSTPQTYYIAGNCRHLVADPNDVNNKDEWVAASTVVMECLKTRQWNVHPEWWFYQGTDCATLFEAVKHD